MTREDSLVVIESIEDIRSVLRTDAIDIVEIDRGDHIIFDYIVNLPDTFPPLTGSDLEIRRAKLRRECRGITFDSASGQVIRRPYHKFFNIGERPGTFTSDINIGDTHWILEKLDGSMIAVYQLGDRLIWGTRKGDTEVSFNPTDFVNNSQRCYVLFAKEQIAAGWTPIFEWVSRKNKIVLDYPQDDLILTAIRNMKTGEYRSYDQLQELCSQWDIPLVGAIAVNTGSSGELETFLKTVDGQENSEGVVIRFVDGQHYKVKNQWYVAIHKAKESLIWEKDIIALILNNQVDDVLPMLDNTDRDRLERYMTAMLNHINDYCVKISHQFNEIFTQSSGDRKTFALILQSNGSQPYERQFLFGMLSDRDVYELVSNHILKNTSSSTKIEEIRPLIGGINWNDF